MSAIPDSTLAASEQLIADLQRQLAEFRAERDEALQRETATAEVLQLINSSPADLAQVFDAILEKAHSLCGAEHGQLYLYDGELLHPGAVRGEVADVLRQPWKPGPDNLSSRLIAGDAFVQVADTGRLNDPISQAASQLTGMRTVLLVPLRKDGVYLGHIVSARKEVRRSPTNRSRCCRTSLRSSRWRMRGCSVNCRPARATSKNRSNIRPRPAMCSTSSAARPPMSSRYWTQ